MDVFFFVFSTYFDKLTFFILRNCLITYTFPTFNDPVAILFFAMNLIFQSTPKGFYYFLCLVT